MEILDITPNHEPISVAREMVELAPGAKAGLAVLIREDGSLWYEMAGQERAYLMWALQRMAQALMTDDGC